tara:strand:+ start:278 stop:724 length:447 start_codon:yes stop_codon:yes gene_type:complete
MYVLVGGDNTVEKYPFTAQELRRRHRNVSFPVPTPEETLNSFGVYSVAHTPRPSYDILMSKVLVSAVYNGEVWEQSYRIIGLGEDQVKGNVAARALDELAKTEQDVMSYLEQNLSVPEDLATFRSYMREVESQDGYPYSLAWPTAPSR